MHHPHDNSYTQLFSNPRMVKDLIQGFVQESWVKELDFNTLEPVATKHLSEDWWKRDNDVIWRLRWKDKWFYIYLLLEFQSTIDDFMGIRCMVYTGLLYQEIIKKEKLTKKDKLPPVLPIVVYNGSKSWDAAVEVYELIETVPVELAKYLPHFHYLLIDEGQYSDAELLPLHHLKNIVSVLFRLENIKSEKDHLSAIETIREEVKQVLNWLHTPQDNVILEDIQRWILRVLIPRNVPEVHIPEVTDIQEMNTMLAETAQKWYQEAEMKGRQEGWLEGRQEGRQEGWLEGHQEGRQEGIAIGEERGELRGRLASLTHSLVTVLKAKFGELPETSYSHINQLNKVQLDHCLKKALSAKTLEEVFKI